MLGLATIAVLIAAESNRLINIGWPTVAVICAAVISLLIWKMSKSGAFHSVHARFGPVEVDLTGVVQQLSEVQDEVRNTRQLAEQIDHAVNNTAVGEPSIRERVELHTDQIHAIHREVHSLSRTMNAGMRDINRRLNCITDHLTGETS